MLNSYKFAERRIRPCLPSDSPDWLDLAAPGDAELDFIRERYQIPHWFLTDSLDPRERPRIDQEGDKLLLVIRLSLKSKGAEGPLFNTVPVGLILTRDVVISVCAHPELVAGHTRPLYGRDRNWSRVRLVFAIFLVAGTGFIENLESMEDEAGQSEARLRKSTRDEEILDILGLEKSLINITTALKSNHALMQKLARSERPFFLSLTQEDSDLLDDAMTESQQAIFMADIFGQVLASLSDAFGSIISNNLNKTMKFLAGVTIILTIPMIIVGAYGMNVALPGGSSTLAFWGLCAFCLVLMLAAGFLFAKKKWF